MRWVQGQRQPVETLGDEDARPTGALNDLALPESFAINQSAGYCPQSSCFDAVEDALWLPGIEHPGGFTSAFEFRRCPGCGERNLVEDDYYVCGACDTPLPTTWNFGADARPVRSR